MYTKMTHNGASIRSFIMFRLIYFNLLFVLLGIVCRSSIVDSNNDGDNISNNGGGNDGDTNANNPATLSFATLGKQAAWNSNPGFPDLSQRAPQEIINAMNDVEPKQQHLRGKEIMNVKQSHTESFKSDDENGLLTTTNTNEQNEQPRSGDGDDEEKDDDDIANDELENSAGGHEKSTDYMTLDDILHDTSHGNNLVDPNDIFAIKDRLPPMDEKTFKVSKYTLAVKQFARRANQQLLRIWGYKRRLKEIRAFGYKNEESKKNTYYKKQWVKEYKQYVDAKVNRKMSAFYPPDQVNELVRIMGRNTEEMNKQNKKIEYKVAINAKLKKELFVPMEDLLKRNKHLPEPESENIVNGMLENSDEFTLQFDEVALLTKLLKKVRDDGPLVETWIKEMYHKHVYHDIPLQFDNESHYDAYKQQKRTNRRASSSILGDNTKTSRFKERVSTSGIGYGQPSASNNWQAKDAIDLWKAYNYEPASANLGKHGGCSTGKLGELKAQNAKCTHVKVPDRRLMTSDPSKYQAQNQKYQRCKTYKSKLDVCEMNNKALLDMNHIANLERCQYPSIDCLGPNPRQYELYEKMWYDLMHLRGEHRAICPIVFKPKLEFPTGKWEASRECSKKLCIMCYKDPIIKCKMKLNAGAKIYKPISELFDAIITTDARSSITGNNENDRHVYRNAAREIEQNNNRLHKPQFEAWEKGFNANFNGNTNSLCWFSKYFLCTHIMRLCPLGDWIARKAKNNMGSLMKKGFCGAKSDKYIKEWLAQGSFKPYSLANKYKAEGCLKKVSTVALYVNRETGCNGHKIPEQLTSMAGKPDADTSYGIDPKKKLGGHEMVLDAGSSDFPADKKYRFVKAKLAKFNRKGKHMTEQYIMSDYEQCLMISWHANYVIKAKKHLKGKGHLDLHSALCRLLGCYQDILLMGQNKGDGEANLKQIFNPHLLKPAIEMDAGAPEKSCKDIMQTTTVGENLGISANLKTGVNIKYKSESLYSFKKCDKDSGGNIRTMELSGGNVVAEAGVGICSQFKAGMTVAEFQYKHKARCGGSQVHFGTDIFAGISGGSPIRFKSASFCDRTTKTWVDALDKFSANPQKNCFDVNFGLPAVGLSVNFNTGFCMGEPNKISRVFVSRTFSSDQKCKDWARQAKFHNTNPCTLTLLASNN
jgi:hypothetical protein